MLGLTINFHACNRKFSFCLQGAVFIDFGYFKTSHGLQFNTIIYTNAQIPFD